MITQADIARRAGVARATVSRVLNGDERVSEETVQKVLQAAQELGYSHPRLDRGKKHFTIIICEGSIGFQLAEGQFFLQTISGISDYCRQAGCSTEIITVRHERYDDLVQEFEGILQTARADGFLLPSVIPITEAILAPFLRRAAPLVLINRYLEERPVDCVVNDDLWVGRFAAKHLLERGHRRIGYIGGVKSASAMRDRFAGFRDVLVDAGVFASQLCSFHEHVTIEAGYESARALLQHDRTLTALFCANDESALGAIRAIRESGLGVPEDVSVIGHDGLVTALDPETTLTTFRFRLYELGYTAAQLLANRIGNPQLPAQHHVVRSEFIPGNTVRSV